MKALRRRRLQAVGGLEPDLDVGVLGGRVGRAQARAQLLGLREGGVQRLDDVAGRGGGRIDDDDDARRRIDVGVAGERAELPATGRCHVARSVPVRLEPSSTAPRARSTTASSPPAARAPAAWRQRAEAQLLPRDGRAVERQCQQRRGGRPGAGRERMVGADLPVDRVDDLAGAGERLDDVVGRTDRRVELVARARPAGRRADVARQPPRPRTQVERRLGPERMEREPRRLGQRVGGDLEVGPHLPRPEHGRRRPRRPRTRPAWRSCARARTACRPGTASRRGGRTRRPAGAADGRDAAPRR